MIVMPWQVVEGKSIGVYGAPFSGKSRRLYTCGLKILLIDFDGSAGSVLHGAPNVMVLKNPQGNKLSTYDDYLYAKSVVQKGYIDTQQGKYMLDYDLVVLDSWTRILEAMKTYVVNGFAPNRSREVKGKFGAKSDWQDWQDLAVDESKWWHSLTKRGPQSINVMHIFHEEYNQQMGRTEFAIQGKYASQSIMAMLDAVFYQTKFTTADAQGNNVVYYAMYTQNAGHVYAEVRLPADKAPLPAMVTTDATWRDILSHMNAVLRSPSAAEAVYNQQS